MKPDLTPEQKRQKAIRDDIRRNKLMFRSHITPSQAAFLTGKSRATIYRWIHQGLSVIHRNGYQYIARKELTRWVADEERRTRRVNPK